MSSGTSLKALAERIDALNLRERALIFTGVLGVLLVLAMNYVFPPLQAQQKQLESQLKTQREQTRMIYAELEGLARASQRDADADNRARIAELNTKLQALGGQSAGSQAVVSPRQMIRLVREVLQRNQALQLVRLENLPPQPLTATGAPTPVPVAADTPPAVAAGNNIYRHGLRIQVRGSYRDIARYVEALESLSWRVYWGEASLKTLAYPVSELTLVLYTLSPNQEWLST